MNKVMRGGCAVGLATALGACSGGQSSSAEDVGTASLAVTTAPSDGSCVQVTAQGVRTVTRAFDVPVGQSTTFSLGGLPLGTVVFSGAAFGGNCASVTAGTVPNWVSDPVTATVVVSPPVFVRLAMHRNGQAGVGVDFPSEPADGGPPVDGGLLAEGGPDAEAGAAACGNGVLEQGEQCDDGNLFDLDGCDSHCNYEVVTRLTSLTLQASAAPAFCAPSTNTLGTQALTSTAIGQLNPQMQTAITGGTSNTMMQFLGLSDLTGANATGYSIGLSSASLDPAKGAWPGNGPIDWWFLADPTTVSGGLPTSVLTGGAIASGALTAGPGNVNLAVPLFGQQQVLEMRGAALAATIGSSPAPNVPSPPPSQLAAGLTVFQTITGNGANQGLCGNVTVESLAQVPVPQSLTTGTSACGTCAGSHTYTYCGSGNPVGPTCNSLLDAIVGGCKVATCLVTAINATQPDVPNSGTVQALTLGANNKVVNATSGDRDAYSSYWGFAANRAHFTGQTCGVTADCQAGRTCTAGKCQ